jgi:hypothetical protein
VTCPNITVGATTTTQFSLAGLCPSLVGSAFGRLMIAENDTSNKPFSVYERVNAAGGDGFSVEGFPIGELATGGANVVSWINGLKRQAAAPGYQTNCFMASLAEATTITYGLRTANNAVLGTDKTLVLAANQYLRILDIFANVGASAGDYSNVRATFKSNNSASYLAFCTVQNNTTFDADFRIAKVDDPSPTTADQSRQFLSTIAVTAGATKDLAGNVLPTVHYPGVQHNWAFYARHPDRISCALSAVTPSGEGEVQLVDPSGTPVAGGACLTSFSEVNLGEKSTRNSGVNGRWQVKVGGCNGVDITAYTLMCSSGNGTSTFTFGGARAAEF